MTDVFVDLAQQLIAVACNTTFQQDVETPKPLDGHCFCRGYRTGESSLSVARKFGAQGDGIAYSPPSCSDGRYHNIPGIVVIAYLGLTTLNYD
jgi:hypothetical protein